MATTWYPLESADGGLFDDAPIIHRYVLRLPVAPRTVWESLTSDEGLAAWGPGIKKLTWTTPRPFGVGSERELVLQGGLVKVREHFFRWDDSPGILGHSFYVTEASIPVLRRLGENYVIEPDGDGALLTWTVAIEPKPKFTAAMKLASPVSRFAFGRMAADGKKYFTARRTLSTSE